jgi:hypothetical protein
MNREKGDFRDSRTRKKVTLYPEKGGFGQRRLGLANLPGKR